MRVSAPMRLAAARSVSARSAPILGLAILAAGCCAASVSSSAFASASANAGDDAATRVYVQADYALVRVARANLATGQAALRGLVRQIRGQCPNAAAGSPQNDDSNELGDEVVGAMAVLVSRPDAHAIDVFARAVEGLRWSNPSLTR